MKTSPVKKAKAKPETSAMMPMTVVTNARGKVIASVEGHVSAPKVQRGMTATLIPQKGQRFHEIHVPKAYAKLDLHDLHKTLATHVKKR